VVTATLILFGGLLQVAGAASLKLIHEKYKGKHAEGNVEALKADMHHAIGNVRDIGGHLSKCAEDLPALVVRYYSTFQRTCLLCLDAKCNCYSMLKGN
jgi:hypothetical protein